MYNLLFDMGGVLMGHNLPGCIAALTRLMGADRMQAVLGLCPNGEGTAHSMMEDFECGRVDEDEFLTRLNEASQPGTTRQQLIDAWMLMHAGIAPWKLEQLRLWHEAGHHLLLLSNSNPIHRRDIVEHYDMSMFDRSFYSHLIGAAKPAPLFYDTVATYLREQGWDHLPTLFVDDIEVNRAMGERYGWRTFESIADLQGYLAK